MPSFDVVSEVEMHEVDNALNQTIKEVTTRYDLKDSGSTLEKDDKAITIKAPDKMALASIGEILKQKLSKRGVGLKSLNFKDPEEASGSTFRQKVEILQGISAEKAKVIVKLVKDLKLKKVQAQVQGEQLRINGPKRDDLQEVIQMLKEKVDDLELQFINFRE